MEMGIMGGRRGITHEKVKGERRKAKLQSGSKGWSELDPERIQDKCN
jgi:hypothetical protein